MKLIVISIFCFFNLVSFSQENSSEPQELFSLTGRANNKVFFLYSEQLKIDSNIFKNILLTDSIPINYLQELKELSKQDTTLSNWKDKQIQGSILVPSRDSVQKIGMKYRESVQNVEDNYWWRYRFDLLGSKESDSLKKQLELEGITPKNYETVESHYRHILYISEPLVTADGNYALMQVESNSSAGFLEGIGYIYLFKKVDRSWSLMHKVFLWVK